MGKIGNLKNIKKNNKINFIQLSEILLGADYLE